MRGSCCGVLGLGLGLWLGVAQASAASLQAEGPARPGALTRLHATFDAPVKGPVRGAAALGGIGPFTQVAPGDWAADYQPPADVGPAQVRIAAFEDRVGGAVVLGTLQVEEEVHLTVKVKSRSPVFVRAGEKRYGPFHPGADRKVELRFGSGGAAQATLETAQGKALQTLALQAREASGLALARPERVRPGDGQPAELLVVLPEGRRMAADKVKAASPGGGAVALKPNFGPGILRWAYTAKVGTRGEQQVSFADEAGKPLGQATFVIAAGQVKQVEVVGPPRPLQPGALSTLSIRLLDADGQPVDGDVQLQASAGEVGLALQVDTGLYTAPYTAPRSSRAAAVQVTARGRSTPEDPLVAGEAKVALASPSVVKVSLSAVPATLAPGQEVEVTFQALDAQGNRAALERFEPTATVGEWVDLKPGAKPGSWTALYRAPAAGGPVTLGARDAEGLLAGTAEAKIAPAESGESPRYWLGPSVGFASNLGQLSTPSLAVVGMVRPLGILGVGALVGYRPGLTKQVPADAAGGPEGTLSLSRLSAHLRVGVIVPVGPLDVQAGAQGGATRMSGSLQVSSLHETAGLGKWVPEVGGYAGAGVRLGPGSLGVELRATWARVDVTEQLVHVTGSVGGVDASVQYLFAF
jgi:hypothetical protein